MEIQKISPFLWFKDNAADAAAFYVSVFKNSEEGTIVRYGQEGAGIEGEVMVVTFKLEGVQFTALNGNPQYQFSEATSFLIRCDTQEEIDYYWEKLSDGGSTMACGWLKDKFGVTWQICPPILINNFEDDDRERATRVMKAMMTMVKFDLAKLEEAYNGTWNP